MMIWFRLNKNQGRFN